MALGRGGLTQVAVLLDGGVLLEEGADIPDPVLEQTLGRDGEDGALPRVGPRAAQHYGRVLRGRGEDGRQFDYATSHPDRKGRFTRLRLVAIEYVVQPSSYTPSSSRMRRIKRAYRYAERTHSDATNQKVTAGAT